MIKAKHHIVIYPFFKCLTRLLIKRYFHSVTFNREFIDNGKAVLIIANHVSWWDGFWVEYLNQKLLQRKLYFMMLEEQLKKHWYFQYTGGYSIKKGSRTVIYSIDYSIQLLKQSGNALLMFPQGHIQSMHNNNMKFERGIERVIANIPPETQVLFVANLVDYLADMKPNLYIYLKMFLAKDLNPTIIEKRYNEFYELAINTQKTLKS
ncbi:MAG: lysophospholipid acyltransferase family protein [Candidatus Kapaibacteriales bacterium]